MIISTVDFVRFSPSHRTIEDAKGSLFIKRRFELTMLNKHQRILIVLIEPFDISFVELFAVGQLF